MIELTSSEYGDILPLLEGFPQQVLPYAICQGINPGRVFADRGSNPRVALIWTTVGYFFLAGDPAEATDLSEIRRVLLEIFLPASQAGGEDSFILIPSSPAWSSAWHKSCPDRRWTKFTAARLPSIHSALRLPATGTGASRPAYIYAEAGCRSGSSD